MTIDNTTPCLDDILIYRYCHPTPSTPFPETFWIEGECKVVQSGDAQPDRGVGGIYVRRNNVCGWLLEFDEGEIFLTWDGVRMATHALDTSFTRRYRLVTNTVTDAADVLVDGQLVLSDVVPGPNCLTPGVFDTMAMFGQFHADEPGITRWNAVRHNLAVGDGVLCASFIQANSVGLIPTVTTSGSRIVANNDLTLHVDGLPPSTFGMFLVSDQGLAIRVPTATGLPICLAGSIGRFTEPAQILLSSSAGTVELTPDLTRVPTTTSFVPVMSGESWTFQYWYRDDNPVFFNSNTTHALEVLFE